MRGPGGPGPNNDGPDRAPFQHQIPFSSLNRPKSAPHSEIEGPPWRHVEWPAHAACAAPVLGQPELEEGIGPLAVPLVTTLEEIVLESLADAERRVDAGQISKGRCGGGGREDPVLAARLDHQRPRRDQRSELAVIGPADDAGPH